jgi:hypothetical protein
MSKIKSNKSGVMPVVYDKFDEFNKFRQEIMDEFSSESLWHKQRLTQTAFWTKLDKDVAVQYFRDERWFFGLKYFDEIKLVDHGIDPKGDSDYNSKGVGFKK